MAKHYFQLNKILKKLLYDRRMRPADLAEAVKLPPPTIHRLVTGKSTRPYRSSLEPIAEYFSISVDQLIGEEPIPETNNSSNNLAPRKIPIINWSDSAQFHNPDHIQLSQHFLLASNNMGSRCFAVIMNDHSMEPIFAKNSHLIIDPDKKPWDRSYILVNTFPNEIIILRQIIFDGEDRYLKPLNPDLSQFKMKYLEPNDTVLGVLIETRINFDLST